MKIFVFVLLSLFGVAFGLDCFVCNSEVDPACGESFSSNSTLIRDNFLMNCPEKEDEEAPFCRVQTMYFNYETRVHRDCGYKRRTAYPDCYQTRAEDHVVDVCQCDDDACNSASFSSSSLFTILTVAVGVMFTSRQ